MESPSPHVELHDSPLDAPPAASASGPTDDESLVVSWNKEQGVLEGIDVTGSKCSFVPHWHSFGTWMAKSKPGCKHCAARKEAMVKIIPEMASEPETYTISWTYHDITFLCEFILVQSPLSEIRNIEVFFYSSNLEKYPFSCLAGYPGPHIGRCPPLDTSSEHSLQFASSCIKHCTQEHSYLCGSGSEKSLPTRVLFVGTASSPTVHLYSSTGDSSRYVCLSYCWGKRSEASPMLQTTTETLDRFKTQISWSELPKTFRDAITFVRLLGIKYIWIDSLCIIQDDADDCAREIGRMASIYSNAFLTIAATSASGPHEGLFSDTSYSNPAQKLTTASEFGPLYARLQADHPWAHDSPGYPLLKRGWVFQERILSRRVLHFAKSELIWECMTASGCECRSFIPTRSLSSQKKKLVPLNSSDDKYTRASKWAAVVLTYSTLHLTVDADVLPALSGLASVWKTKYRDQYLAGLWRSHLVIDLAWKRYAYSSRKRFQYPRKHQEYEAPSWSWASRTIGDTVRFPSIIQASCNEIAEIIDAKCIPRNVEDPTGRVSSGYIKLVSNAAPGKLNLKLSSVVFQGRRQYVDSDCDPESKEVDVFVVALFMSTYALEELEFLIISAHPDLPNTYERRGVSQTVIRQKNVDLGSVGWTGEDREWWTSKGGEGWMEFIII